MAGLNLLPAPRTLIENSGTFNASDGLLIVMPGGESRLRTAARWVQAALESHAGQRWELVVGNSVPNEQVGLRFTIAAGSMPHAQGYWLLVTPDSIEIMADTVEGALYAAATLSQIIEQRGATLPCLRIDDWPDFPVRGVMLDVSRDKVPMMETLRALIDRLARWKINQLQLYTEHTFAYRQHPEVWRDASPITGAEVLELDAFCGERGIELVPNQNTFGHMRRWLIHERYRPLAECPDGCDTGDPEWGYFDEPFTLCPEDPRSLELVRSLLDELLPHFSSGQVNIGCDETIELGLGRSAEAVRARGKGRVYLDFVQSIASEVRARGRTLQLWADMILREPELVPELPRDCVALVWGYEAHHPFPEQAARLAATGIPFYVCPGTSSWNSVAGRTANAIANLRSAAESGLANGASGYLITDWGDNGHWQPLPVSYMGFAYGAALAWCGASNAEVALPAALDAHIFRDAAGVLGQLIYELGNVYSDLGPQLHNNSALFLILKGRPDEVAVLAGIDAQQLLRRHDQIAAIADRLPQAAPACADAELVRREIAWAAALLQHACLRGAWALGDRPEDLRGRLAAQIGPLIEEHRAIWLARNRTGGLADSSARLAALRDDYAER